MGTTRPWLGWASAAALVAATAIGCGSSSTSSSTVSAIAISPSPCGVSRTNSTQLTASATLHDGTKQDITSTFGVKWSTGDSNTATVNQSGVLVGVNPGVTGVTVEYQGASGSEDCTVTP
jgi:hypothetical protein